MGRVGLGCGFGLYVCMDAWMGGCAGDVREMSCMYRKRVCVCVCVVYV